MRIKDQELILEQVKEQIDMQGLAVLNTRQDVLDLCQQLDTRIETITDLIAQQIDLEKQIKDLRNDMQSRVEDFNNANNFEEVYSYSKTGQGFHFDKGYSEKAPSYKLVWNMKHKDYRALETKLRLTTMGGDFDVFKLIKDLVAEFS
jgi:maltodextrin utilization protein YvdJ